MSEEDNQPLRLIFSVGEKGEEREFFIFLNRVLVVGENVPTDFNEYLLTKRITLSSLGEAILDGMLDEEEDYFADFCRNGIRINKSSVLTTREVMAQVISVIYEVVGEEVTYHVSFKGATSEHFKKCVLDYLRRKPVDLLEG